MLATEQRPVGDTSYKEKGKGRLAKIAAGVVFLGSGYGLWHSTNTIIDIQQDARATVAAEQGVQLGKRFEREVAKVNNADPRNDQLDWLVPLSAIGTSVGTIGGICLLFSDRRRK